MYSQNNPYSVANMYLHTGSNHIYLALSSSVAFFTNYCSLEREVTSTYTQPTPGQVSTAAVSEEPTDDSLVIALSVSLGTGFLVFSVVLITICVCKRLRGGPKTKRISLIHDE